MPARPDQIIVFAVSPACVSFVSARPSLRPCFLSWSTPAPQCIASQTIAALLTHTCLRLAAMLHSHLPCICNRDCHRCVRPGAFPAYRLRPDRDLPNFRGKSVESTVSEQGASPSPPSPFVHSQCSTPTSCQSPPSNRLVAY